MKKFYQSLVAISLTSAFALSAHAATYQVVDKGDVASLKYTYAQQENDLGETAISGTKLYNIPIQFKYLDKDDYDRIVTLANREHVRVLELNNIEDEVSLRAGNPTANDFSWVLRWLNSTTSSLYQKVGDTIAMVNLGGQTQEIVVFDQPFEGTNTLTRSTVDFINGITDSGMIYGNASAPYLPLDFTESDGDKVTHWVRKFSNRAFYSFDKGETIQSVMPPETKFFGGQSAILDVNGTTAVGYASNKLNVNRVETIEDDTGGCADPNVVDDIPYDICIQNISSDLYHLMAYQWDIDPTNGVTNGKELGLLVTPNAEDERIYLSYAQAVNASGVAVGFSHGWVDEKKTNPDKNERRSFYAVMYKNGEVVSFTKDHGKYFESRAYDINDKGIAVGHVSTFVNGSLRTKFYHVDTNASASEIEFVQPKDFFEGSSSTARAINENGFIVGEGEVETHNSRNKPRRRHAFLYDINNKTFTNINEFLSCDSPYTIVEARDINESNEISATAIVKVPRRNAKGELMVDENGKQLVEDIVRAVTLKPTNGELEDCSVVKEKVKRKGASLGYWVLGLLALIGFRRKYN